VKCCRRCEVHFEGNGSPPVRGVVREHRLLGTSWLFGAPGELAEIGGVAVLYEDQ
jgi:hypothetical protein